MKKKFFALLLCLAMLLTAVSGQAASVFPAAAADYADAMGKLLTDMFGFSYEWQQNTLLCDSLLPIAVFADTDTMLQSVICEAEVSSDDTDERSEKLQRFGLSIAVMAYSWRFLALNGDMLALTEEAPAISEALSAISGMGADLQPNEDGKLMQTVLFPVVGVVLSLQLTFDSETGVMLWRAALISP